METRITRRTVLTVGAGLLLSGCGVRKTAPRSNAPFDPLVDDDALAMAARVRQREVSPLELVDIVITRIEALNGQLNALTTRTFERARTRALLTSDGLFAGVPFLIKDMIDVAGVPRTDGADAFFTHTPRRSPALSRALEASGLNIVGVTNVPEFATLPSTVNARFGATLNPWDITRTPAGSSGGSAVAVAAGWVPLAHATDGAGSIRLPSSYCGVFGFKPSHARTVAGETGNRHDTVKHHHGISRSVRDSSALLSVTEDRSGGARYAPIGFVRSEEEGGVRRSPLRVGIDLAGLEGLTLDDDVNSAMKRTTVLLGDLGHEVRPLPRIDLSSSEFWAAIETVFLARMPQLVQLVEQRTGRAVDEAGVLSPFALSFIERGRGLSPDALLRSADYFAHCARVYRSWLGEVDVVLSPVQATGPPAVDRWSERSNWSADGTSINSFMSFTALANVTGAPAMSVPLYWTPSGLPIGSQFSAALGQDRVLFELAYQLEAASPWRGRWAPISIGTR